MFGGIRGGVRLFGGVRVGVRLFGGIRGGVRLFGVGRVDRGGDALNAREVGKPTLRKERDRVGGEERKENRAANENGERRADAPRNETFRRLRRRIVAENVADEPSRNEKERDV